jgi:hypothetical protein
MSAPKASGERIAHPIAIMLALSVLSWAIVVLLIAAVWWLLSGANPNQQQGALSRPT